MKEWQVWVEGYLATGMEGIPEKASLLGTFQAETFLEACDKWNESRPPEERIYYKRDPSRNSTSAYDWGRRLFDNERDARRFLG